MENENNRQDNRLETDHLIYKTEKVGNSKDLSLKAEISSHFKFGKTFTPLKKVLPGLN